MVEIGDPHRPEPTGVGVRPRRPAHAQQRGARAVPPASGAAGARRRGGGGGGRDGVHGEEAPLAGLPGARPPAAAEPRRLFAVLHRDRIEYVSPSLRWFSGWTTQLLRAGTVCISVTMSRRPGDSHATVTVVMDGRVTRTPLGVFRS